MNIFDFAMKMELQGKACYESMAASTRMAGLRTIFLGLAADEQKHYDVLRELKAGNEWPMADSTMLERARTVFAELLDRREGVEELHEDLDAYKLGLKMEEESIALYEGQAKKEDDPDLVQLYLRLANEEKKHFTILENVCDFVTRPRYYFAWQESNRHEL